jgi:hypothetical protein
MTRISPYLPRLIFIIGLLILVADFKPMYAQPTPEATASTPSEVANKPPPTGNAPPPQAASGYLSTHEFHLTIIISVLSVLALLMEFFLLKSAQNLKPEEILRVFGVTLIILGTLYFVTAGYDSNQIAPAMGLFGTVAGYLLGRATGRNAPEGATEGKDTSNEKK